MRRLFGCLFILMLVAAIFLVLLVRGPGLRSLPILAEAEPLVDIVTRRLGGGNPPQPRRPASVTPTAHPSAILTPTPTTTLPTSTPESPGVELAVSVYSLNNEPLAIIVDGNGIALAAHVANLTSATVDGTVSFSLKPPGAGRPPITACDISVAPDGEASCTARAVADGWAWESHRRVEQRTLYATLTGHEVVASVEVSVQPKPVVLVHGFTSDAATWSAWTGPDGFLARWGIPGYAVGDDHFDIEPMDTGDFTQPRRPTNSIVENAEIVARYIEAVRQATGAERIDLVAHSMGGLISRYYVGHYMPVVERPGLPTVPVVNQLYMIGTPNAGTPCAIPPAALGLYPPATTQLTPTYVQYLFNRRTNDPRGVPFLVLAGDPVRDYAALVCSPVPTDVFVSVASAAGAIPILARMMPVRHGQQTKSPAVLQTVLQSLSRDPSGYPIPMPTNPAVAPPSSSGLQVALVGSGTISADRLTAVNVTIDEAKSASFLLYAPGRNLELSILSSDGQRITTETAESVPDVSVATAEGRGVMATQGFHIERPEAGQWQLIVMPRAGAQADEVFYAVAAFLQSDLHLSAETPSASVSAGQPVVLRATLSGPVALDTVTLAATVRNGRGEVAGEVVLLDDGVHDDGAAGDGVFGGNWTSSEVGLYSVVVRASGQNRAGKPFQRLELLAVEVQ